MHPTPTVDRQLPWMEHRRADIQAAMWVLGRRPRSHPEWQLYLSRVDLRGVFLDGRLSKAMFRHANLARGYMPNVQLDDADLEDADLREANLRGARLTGANLRKAHLQGADLRGADLRGADLRGADLRGVRHEGSHFTGARANPQTTWPDDLGPDRRRQAGIVEEGAEISPAPGTS